MEGDCISALCDEGRCVGHRACTSAPAIRPAISPVCSGMLGLFHIQPLETEPLVTSSPDALLFLLLLFLLPLFLLPPFLFLLLFLRGRLRFRLLELRRRRRLSRDRRRSALLLAFGRRRRLRARSGLVPAWLGLAGCRTSGFRTVIRLRRRAVIARRWLSWVIRLGTSRLRLIVWLTWPVIR